MYDEPNSSARHHPSYGLDSVKRRLELTSLRAPVEESMVEDCTPQDGWAVEKEPTFHPKLLVMNPISVTVGSMKVRSWKFLRSCREQAVRIGLVAFVTLLLIGLWTRFGNGLTLRHSTNAKEPVYKVVLDAGSTGTRIHVFKFRQSDGEIILEPTADTEMTFYRKVDGGLSSYKNNPEGARRGLEWLLKEASIGVPEAVGSQALLLATAGLRLIPRVAAEELLQVSRRVIRESPFTLVRDEDVAILDGSSEGLYMWRSVDFTYGQSRHASKPSAVVDLGGGSVQLAYRMMGESQITPSDRTKFTGYLRSSDPIASSTSTKKDYFLVSASAESVTSDGPLYVHSWLGYGLEAARQRVLEENVNGTCPCLTSSNDDLPQYYDYAGVRLALLPDDSLPSSSTRYDRCLATVRDALDLDQDCGAAQASECAFDGAWRGPIDPASYTFRVFSYVFDVARSNGLVPTAAHEVVITVAKFREVARARCSEATDGNPWACLDSVYVTSLLSDGFGIPETEPIVVAERLSYAKGLIYAAWPLGAALETIQ